MKIPSVLFLFSFMVLAAAIALPPSSANTQIKPRTPEVDYESPGYGYEAGITARGNIEDYTILERDVIPDHLERREPIWARALAFLQRRETNMEATDRLLFVENLDVFLQKKGQKDPASLDWGDNGCTASPDRPMGFNFLPSCQRHDFGYRNYKSQGRFTESNRGRIDNNFKSDMYNECGKKKPIERELCKGWAKLYYRAVSEFGNL